MSSVCPPSGRPKDGSRVYAHTDTHTHTHTHKHREREREREKTGREKKPSEGFGWVSSAPIRKFRVKRAQSAEKGRKSVLESSFFSSVSAKREHYLYNKNPSFATAESQIKEEKSAGEIFIFAFF
jgi:hypothetical protein